MALRSCYYEKISFDFKKFFARWRPRPIITKNKIRIRARLTFNLMNEDTTFETFEVNEDYFMNTIILMYYNNFTSDQGNGRRKKKFAATGYFFWFFTSIFLLNQIISTFFKTTLNTIFVD